MTQQISKNIWQFTHGANIMLAQLDENELILIDAGLPGSTSKIVEEIRELGFQPNQVEHILVTHADMDHAGSLHGIKNATGAKLYASVLSTPYIEKARMPKHLPFLMQPFANLIQRFTQKRVLVDVGVEDGQVLDIGGGIKAIHVPGHTQDHFAYWWEREKVLFVADLLQRRTGSLELTAKPVTWDMDQAKQSARKVLALEPEVICVGHGDSFKVSDSPDEVANLRNKLAS